MSDSPLVLSAPPLLHLEARSEEEAITETLSILRGHGVVKDFVKFSAAVFERQRINPPVLGNGVALPHARTAMVGELVFAAARCRTDVPFGPEGVPVRLIFLFGVPHHQIAEYLAATATLVKRLRSNEVREGLLTTEDAARFRALLVS